MDSDPSVAPGQAPNVRQPPDPSRSLRARPGRHFTVAGAAPRDPGNSESKAPGVVAASLLFILSSARYGRPADGCFKQEMDCPRSLTLSMPMKQLQPLAGPCNYGSLLQVGLPQPRSAETGDTGVLEGSRQELVAQHMGIVAIALHPQVGRRRSAQNIQ